MANKTFNTRVKNKRDTAANWEAVATTFQPLDGELIIVDTAAGKTRFKVGRYDTAKGRLLYYNEIPFTDEYLYNDLNESQGKIYDKLKGIDDKSIIEMTLEPSDDNGKVCVYHIGLWQFPKTGLYKIHLTQHGTTSDLFKVFARKTKDDGTLPEDFTQDNLVIQQLAMGDTQVNDLYIQVDYTDNDKLTVYNVRFLTLLQPYNAQVNVYDKTTQKWQFVSATYVQSAKSANRLAHQLTLTKGDTTTKFDGSTAQTVSIPTKTSELTNDSNFTTQTDLDNLTNTVVSYNAQENITDEQKAQARTNIGAISEADLVQPDWNQNDTTAKDYIKNRICYDNSVSISTTIDSSNIYITNSLTNEDLNTFSDWCTGASPVNLKINNTVYTLQPGGFADGIYTLNYNNTAAITRNIRGTADYLSIKDGFPVEKTAGLSFTLYVGAIKQIDKKYIPDELFTQANWNENNETSPAYIQNRICYEGETVTELGNTAEVWVSLVGEEASTSVLKLLDIPISYKIKGILYENQKPSKMEDYVMYYGERYGENPEYVMISTYSPHNISFNGMEASDFQFVKIENTVKQIDSKFIPTVSPDWNQNDETAKDYIKNRPGAYFSGETIEITQSLENLTWHTQDTLKMAQIQRTDIPDKLYENIPYEICWGNEKHYIKLTSIDGQLKFGDIDNEGMPVFTNYPFFIQPVPSNGLAIALPNTSTPPSSISIKFNQGLVKLSEGYIDQIPGKISLYNRTSNICSVDTLEIGVIEDNEFYGVENNQIGYLPTSNGVSGGLALFSPIPPFNQARMTWSGANSLSKFLSNSKSFNSDFGDNVQENVRYNQALSEIHRYSYTLDHCRATIGFAGNDYYNFKLYCDTTTSTKAIPTAIGYTVKNNKVYQLKVTANNLSTNGQVDFVFTEFLDLDTIASKSDISTIDTALSSTSENPVQNKVVKAAVDDLQASIDSKPSAADAVYTATAASTDGVAYTATVSGIDSLTVGASFIMIPNKASTSKAPTLNVNGLGAKPIRRRLSSLTTSLQQGYSTNWIALNKPFTVVYDGTAWVIEGLTKTDGADVYGAVAQATADAKGNNIAETYATIVMLQSLLPKVTTITLTSNWVGDASPYYQDIALSCVTETSIVDLQPAPEQLNSWQDDGIAFTTLSGNGTVRVYVAGGKPSSAISVQVRVQEVTVI